MAENIRADNVTVKFKGAWDVDYECLDDQNMCGAFDQYGSSGKVNVRWTHPGGTAQNDIFLAFRSGNESNFGKPNRNFVVMGDFDCLRGVKESVHVRALKLVFLGCFLAACDGTKWHLF